jgi:hypothetical protein
MPAERLRAAEEEEERYRANSRLDQIQGFESIPEQQLSRSSEDVSETYERQMMTSENENIELIAQQSSRG